MVTRLLLMATVAWAVMLSTPTLAQTYTNVDANTLETCA